MKRILHSRLADRMVIIGFKQLVGVFVFSTRFGKQTYFKRAIQSVWSAAR